MEKRHMYVLLFSFVVLSVTTVVSSQSPDFLIRTNQKETAAVKFNKSPDFGQENKNIQQLNENLDDKALQADTHVLKDSQLNPDGLTELASDTNLKSTQFTENAGRDNQNGNIPSENQGFGNRDDEYKDVNKKFEEEVNKDTYGGKAEDDKEILPVLSKNDFNSEESEKYFENANKVEPQNTNKDAKDLKNLEKEENPGKITDIKEFGKADETKIDNEEEAKTEFENVEKQEAENNVKDTKIFENVEETMFRDKTDKLKTEENVKEEESQENINDRKYFVTSEADEPDYHKSGRKENENFRKEETKDTLEDRKDFESREKEESREQAVSNEELAEKPEKEFDRREKIDHTYIRESIGYPTISTLHIEQNSHQDISLKENQTSFEDEKEAFRVSSVGGNNQMSKEDSQKVHNGSRKDAERKNNKDMGDKVENEKENNVEYNSPNQEMENKVKKNEINDVTKFDTTKGKLNIDKQNIDALKSFKFPSGFITKEPGLKMNNDRGHHFQGAEINQQLARVQTVYDTQNKSFEDAKVVIFTKQRNENITQTSKMFSETSGTQNTFPSTLTTPSILKNPHRPKTFTTKSPQKPKKITKQIHKTANYMANTATTLLPAVGLKGDETMSNNNATTNTINQNTKNVKPNKISDNNNSSGKKLSTNNAENILIKDGDTHKYTANGVHVQEYVQQGKDSAITPDDDTKSVFQYDNARDNVQLKEAADTTENDDNPCKDLSDPMKQYSSRALIAAAVGGVFVGAVTVLLLFHLKQKCRNYIRGDYRRVPMEYDFELNPRFKAS